MEKSFFLVSKAKGALLSCRHELEELKVVLVGAVANRRNSFSVSTLMYTIHAGKYDMQWLFV